MNNRPSITVRSVDSLQENLQQIESLIRDRAYERFLERGQRDGQDQDDWFNATSDVLQQPLMTLSETDNQTTIVLSLQSPEISEIEILSTQDAILIRGEVRPGRTIFKHIQLSRHIDAESVRAEFQNGTLRCTAATEAIHFLHAKTA